MDKKLCALTFDDGPNTTTTVEILDLLEQRGVKASFFVCGDNINETTAPVVRRAADMGCEICNHSRTHSPFTELTSEQMLAEIDYTSDAVEKITGYAPRFFRPPYIAVNDQVFETVRLPMICGIGAKDWLDEISAVQRYELILEQMAPGAIILLHDMSGNRATVEAVDMLIDELSRRGYSFVTVSELFDGYGTDAAANRFLYSFANQKTKMPELTIDGKKYNQ